MNKISIYKYDKKIFQIYENISDSEEIKEKNRICLYFLKLIFLI